VKFARRVGGAEVRTAAKTFHYRDFRIVITGSDREMGIDCGRVERDRIPPRR
jgi:hypothetical protein